MVLQALAWCFESGSQREGIVFPSLPTVMSDFATQRRTALCLAIENQWGGHASKDKGAALMNEVIHWFYGKKGQN